MKSIGIILRDYQSLSNNSLYGIRTDLIKYLNNYEIDIICLPIIFENNDFSRVEEGIKLCDGIILPGGEKTYDIDLKIARYLYENNIPTLGICLGMQIIAKTFDGNMDYLKDNKHQSNKIYVHQVNIKDNSKLKSILKDNKIMVNSRHNEYIINTNLDIVAISDDYIIEAVEDKSKRFFIGVQWHPESINNDLYSKRLFDAFIDSL
jgi:putative glutamine amidotransferase